MTTKNLCPLFFDLAESRPDRLYLYAGNREVTYGQARAMFRSFAELIRRQGWGADTNTIAVATDDAEKLLFTIWACLHAGTSLVFCPRCENIAQVRSSMKETGAKTLLTDVANLCQKKWAVSLNEILRSIEADAPLSENRDCETAPDLGEPAFMFQTSGTEGEAKWVQCHFKKCFDAVECMSEGGALEHARRQTVFLTPPLFHSYGLSSLLEYTRVGSTIILPSRATPFGPVGELRDKALAGRITAIEGVSDFYFQLSKLAGRINLPSIRHFGYGGGGIDPEVVHRLREYYPDLTFSVRYGLTETPSVVSHKVFRSPYSQNWASSGRILPIYQVEIVDESSKVMGPGQEGTIVVKGKCVANYLGEKSDAPENVLRTGDIGYLNHEDELIVVGRKSVFLKYRGYRLSPESIESVIRSFHSVKDCRVSIIGKSLIAEVVSFESSFSKSDLLKHVGVRLPVYSLPEDVIEVEEIPRTLSGKIIRHD